MRKINYSRYCLKSIYYFNKIVNFLTIFKRPSSSTKDDIANVITQLANSETKVLMTLLCCSSPIARAELKLGQNIHKNIVPKRKEGLRKY